MVIISMITITTITRTIITVHSSRFRHPRGHDLVQRSFASLLKPIEVFVLGVVVVVVVVVVNVVVVERCWEHRLDITEVEVAS